MIRVNAMVVDDSGIMRKLVMRAIQECHLALFAFTEATDGVDALAKFNPETHQMLFVDWNMLNMNGMDFVRKVREMEKQHVFVIMVATERTMGKVEKATGRAGVDSHVCKPLTTELLRSKLEPLVATLSAPPEPGFFAKLTETRVTSMWFEPKGNRK